MNCRLADGRALYRFEDWALGEHGSRESNLTMSQITTAEAGWASRRTLTGEGAGFRYRMHVLVSSSHITAVPDAFHRNKAPRTA